MAKEHWDNIPKQYGGRWAYDLDTRTGFFFVHNNGHRICESEDSEVADAICRAHNADCCITEAPKSVQPQVDVAEFVKTL